MGCGSDFSNGIITLFKDFYKYNPTTNEWTKIDDFTGNARTMAIYFTLGDAGYFGLGAGTTAQNMKDFWKFQPTE